LDETLRLTRALDPLLASPTKLRLLRTLLASHNRTWTGRELSGAARVSSAQGARDLKDLAEVGIVLRDVKGRSYSWRANPDHVLFETLSSLFRDEEGLRAELVRQISSCLKSSPIERAFLFGSFARGEERPDSDVDLYVEVKGEAERPRVAAALGRAKTRIWTRFGNPVSAIVYTKAQSRRPANPALMATIYREGIQVR
jgi:predicted nucleotidyltransferase